MLLDGNVTHLLKIERLGDAWHRAQGLLKGHGWRREFHLVVMHPEANFATRIDSENAANFDRKSDTAFPGQPSLIFAPESRRLTADVWTDLHVGIISSGEVRSQ